MRELFRSNTLVYLLYGQNSRYLRELEYSVLSALRETRRPADDPSVLIFSDKPLSSKRFSFRNYVIPKAEFDEWTLHGRYNHLMKIFVVLRALQLVDGPIVFVDTDTEFRADPQRLFERLNDHCALMHDIDGRLRQQDAWRPLIAAAPEHGLADIVHPDAIIYNSGLIGVTPDMRPALEDAIELAKKLNSINSVFNIEQFVIGHCLSRDGAIFLGAEFVVHYWGWMKPVYERLIPVALREDEEVSRFGTPVNLPKIEAPKKSRRAQLQAKIVATIFRLSPDQQFAYLCDLCCLAATRETDRDIWRAVAVAAIKNDTDAPSFSRKFLSEGTRSLLR